MVQSCHMNTITSDSHLRRFAYFVAGPRDFAINVAINGTVAWWIFGGSESVPLAGTESIFKMLLPMSAIESTLTSFFGLLSGSRELSERAAIKTMILQRNWIALAIGFSLIQGILGFSVFVAAMYAARWIAPEATLSPRSVPLIVGLLSGILAYVLHSKAVIKAETLFSGGRTT